MPSLENVPKQHEELAWRVIAGEAVIVPPHQPAEGIRELTILNPTATRIWELCRGDMTIRRIVDALREEYDETPRLLEEEVVRTIEELSDRGFVILAHEHAG